MCDEYQSEIKDITIEHRLYRHFSYIQKNAEYFYILYKNGLDQLAYKKFSTILPDTMPIWSNDDFEQTYRSAYIVAGIEAL